MGTLTLPPYFNIQEDCKDLRAAFKGINSCLQHELSQTHSRFEGGLELILGRGPLDLIK